MPKEAWFYTFSDELMKGNRDDVWGTNQKLMRDSVGVGFHFKAAVGRKELEHSKLYFSPLAKLLGCYAMLPASTFTVICANFLKI